MRKNFIITVAFIFCMGYISYAQPQPTKASIDASAAVGKIWAEKINTLTGKNSSGSNRKIIADKSMAYIGQDAYAGYIAFLNIKMAAEDFQPILQLLTKEHRILIKSLSKYSTGTYLADRDKSLPTVFYPETAPWPGQPFGSTQKGSTSTESAPKYVLSSEGIRYLKAGNDAYKAKKYDLAEQEYDKLIANDPQYFGGYLNRGLTFFDNQKYSKALNDFSNAIALEPGNIKLYYQRGRTYSYLNKYDSTISDMDKILSIDSKYGPAYTQRSYAHCQRGEVDQANADRETGNKYGEKYDVVCAKKAPARESFAKGEELSRAKKYKEAIIFYDDFIKRNPDDSYAFNNRGTIYYQEEAYNKAIADFTKSYYLKRTNEKALANRASTYYKIQNYEESKDDYVTLTNLYPDNHLYFYQLGRCNAHLKLFDTAILQFEKALTKTGKIEKKETTQIYAARGLAYGQLKKYDDAIKDFNIAIGIDPEYVEAYQYRANAYNMLGRKKEQFTDLTKVISLNPIVAQYHMDRAVAYQNSNEDSLALHDYESVLALAPTNQYALRNIGVLHYSGLKYQSALANFKRAIEISPKYADAWYWLGRVYGAMKNYDEAINAIRKAIELNPDYNENFFQLGFMYGRKNDYKNAISNLDIFIAKNDKVKAAYNNRGWYRYNVSDHSGASEDFTKAISLDKDYGQAYVNRALSYCAQGLKGLARKDEAMAIVLGEKVVKMCQ